MEQTYWRTLQLDRHSPIPLYQQLSDLIAKLISGGSLNPKDQLPSENELIGLFSVSRSVVRQTLNSLSQQGLITTEHGKGSFVAACKIDKPLDVLQSYHAAMKTAGLQVDVSIIRKEIVTPPYDIAERLHLAPEDNALLLERVAYSDGMPINMLISYIAPRSCGLNDLLEFSGGSLYKHFSENCGIHLNYAKSHIEVIFASENKSRLLNLARGATMFQVVSVSFDRSGDPVEVSRVVYPATMFRFQFESHLSDDFDHSGLIMVPKP